MFCASSFGSAAAAAGAPPTVAAPAFASSGLATRVVSAAASATVAAPAVSSLGSATRAASAAAAATVAAPAASSSGSATRAAGAAAAATVAAATHGDLVFPWGATDQAHSIDNAGGRADKLETHPGGYVSAYTLATQQVRHVFGLGRGRVIIRSVAKKYKLSWRTPLAPHSQQTRTMLYESKRVPPNFLRNMAAIVYGLRFLLREAIEGARRQSGKKRRKTQVMCGANTLAARQYRLLGRSVLDPEMLLFISMRYDHRRQASLRYAQQAQSVEISGLDKVVMQAETDVVMMFKIASIRAVLGIIHLAWTLSRVVKKTGLEAFTTVMLWHVSSRHYPTLIPILLEFVFRGRSGA